MSDDFDWHGERDRDAIVLGYQPPTAVYSTVGGNIVVRQKADETEEYDPQIFVTPQGALAVAWALIEEANQAGLPRQPLSLRVESPHWPPPRPGKDVCPANPEAPKAAGDAAPLFSVLEQTA